MSIPNAPDPGTDPPTSPREDDEFAEIEQGPPRGARTMAVVRWLLVAVMAVLAVSSVLYYFGRLPSAGAADQQGAREYYCPMHPGVRQDHPGECPICGMSLVPKENGDAGSSRDMSMGGPSAGGDAGAMTTEPYSCPMHPEVGSKDPNARCPTCRMKLEPSPARGGDAGSATTAMDGGLEMQPDIPDMVPIDLSAERIQLIGMRTAKVTRGRLVPQLRTVGVVSATEDGLAKVNARFAGWIQKLLVTQTGQRVTRGQVLAVVYSPEVLVAEQELFAARRWAQTPLLGATGDAGAAGLDVDARRKLTLLGIAAEDVAQLEKSDKPQPVVNLRSPANGYVFQKAAIEGLYFQPGTELFTIADLSRVWVLADVYENEIARVKLGQRAKIQVSAASGAPFEGTVKFVYPTLDASTRTMRVRIELPNRDGLLRPGMFGDVVVDLAQAEGLVVPREAVVDTGEHQYVFVAQDGGHFEPRPVKVGARAGNEVEIAAGLREGETVVTTGNFLLDSESRLRAVVDQGPKTPTAAGQGPGCESDFDKAKFADKYQQCRSCEVVHRGMGTMEQDCKNAIPKPWR